MCPCVVAYNVILSSAIGLGLNIFPRDCILAILMKNFDNFFRCDVACNYNLVQLFVHVICLNIFNLLNNLENFLNTLVTV
uniref:Uncharacterized protein n=1 Tax=Lotus japonicus TaxID=34305 RepID=I3S650_LOTJA|nr:unknown [Lotus japonicus]